MLLATTAGAVGFYVMACLGFGYVLARSFMTADADADRAIPLGVWGTSFLLGQGLLANVWLLLALGAHFSPQIIMGVVALGVVALGIVCLPRLVLIPRLYRSFLSSLEMSPPIWIVLAGMTVLLFMYQAVLALQPLRPGEDAAVFYMAIAKLISSSYKLVPLTGLESFTQIGLQAELHYAALMSLNGPQAARLFNWAEALAVGAMSVALASHLGLGRRGKWIVLMIVITSTVVTHSIWVAKVDLFAAAMGIAAYYWGLHVGDGRKSTALPLAGLFTGLAVVAKIPYAATLLPSVLILVVWRRLLDANPRTASRILVLVVRTVLAFGFWVVLPLLPHMFKNSRLFGEPLAPFVGPWFSVWVKDTSVSAELPASSLWAFPIMLTFGKSQLQIGNLSPLLLAFAPLVLLLPKAQRWSRSPMVQLSLAAIMGIMLWKFVRPYAIAPRFLLATLLVLSVPVAAGAEYLFQAKSQSRWLRTAVLFCLGFMLTMTMHTHLRQIRSTDPLRHALGLLPECDAQVSICRAFDVVNQKALPGERVFLTAHYPYWLRADLAQCSSSETEHAEHLQAEKRWAYLHDRGFQYVIFYEDAYEGVRDSFNLDSVPDWLHIETLYRDGGYAVFHLKYRDRSQKPRVVCRQLKAPAWDVV
ncbi:MAG: hypothetical protein Q8R76_07965 [Candidatus Omnitrophota bacterium]|nr:hypothetical protein [Candidatus Omnitrophota bacterium]